MASCDCCNHRRRFSQGHKLAKGCWTPDWRGPDGSRIDLLGRRAEKITNAGQPLWGIAHKRGVFSRPALVTASVICSCSPRCYFLCLFRKVIIIFEFHFIIEKNIRKTRQCLCPVLSMNGLVLYHITSNHFNIAQHVET